MDQPAVLYTGGHHSLEVTILVDLVGIGALPRAMGSLQLTKAIGALVSVPVGGKPAPLSHLYNKISTILVKGKYEKETPTPSPEIHFTCYMPVSTGER